MTELLAVPCWDTPETTLTAWVESLRGQGLAVVATTESPGVSWIESTTARLRGYVMMNGLVVEAINFEFHDADPAHARKLVESAAAALSWEVHDDDDEDGTPDD